jgi:hypothetical protein
MRRAIDEESVVHSVTILNISSKAECIFFYRP